jgi:hypothetical protein
MALCLQFDPLRITIDGLGREAKDVGNLFVSLAIRNEFEYVNLASAKLRHHGISNISYRQSDCHDADASLIAYALSLITSISPR